MCVLCGSENKQRSFPSTRSSQTLSLAYHKVKCKKVLSTNSNLLYLNKRSMADSGMSCVMFAAVQRISKYIWLVFYLLLTVFILFIYTHRYCIRSVNELYKLGV